MGCGIGGISSKNPFDRTLARAAAELEALLTSRGVDSYGWFDGYNVHKSPGDFTESKAYEKFPDYIMKGQKKPVYRVYLHTRAATQGDPEVNKNNHPFALGDFYMAHNGSFFSWDDFRNPWGIECDSFPLLFWIYKEHLENDIDTMEAIKKGLEHVRGQYAIWLYNRDTEKTYLFRNRSATFTLFYWEGPDLTIFASEKEMVEKAARYAGYAGTPIQRVKPHVIYEMDNRKIEEKGRFSGRKYNFRKSKKRVKQFFSDTKGDYFRDKDDDSTDDRGASWI